MRICAVVLLALILLAFAAVRPHLQVSQAIRQTQPDPVQTQEQKHRKLNAVPGEIIVRFRDSAATKNARALLLTIESRQLTVEFERLAPEELVSGLRIAKVAPDETLFALEGLRARPDVIYAEPNFIRRKYVVPNDPRFSELWGLKNSGQGGIGFVGADIDATLAWDIITGGSGIVVAVIDEGIDVGHQDLNANVWINPGETAGNSIDDDGNGFIDDINGFDFAHNDGGVYDGPGTNPDGSSIDEHGTHVAGTIGAVGNNGIGVVGVNWQARLMSLKFLGPDGGSSADLIRALGYAKMMRDRWVSSGGTQGANVRVTNNSYGGFEYSQAEVDAIQSLNSSDILFVAAAGNERQDNNIVPAYPASYDLPNIISVAASDRLDGLAIFSNKGTRTVHLAAPGQQILSTTPGNSYGVFSGTSMASPHVAGAAALILAVHPDFHVSRVRGAVLFGSEVLPTSVGSASTTGARLNAFSALQNASEVDNTPPASIADLRIGAQAGRSLSLSWTSPGDDGNSGRAAQSEIRFVDQTTNERFLLVVKRPPAGGLADNANVNIPYQHPAGQMIIRTIDNAGNSSETSVNVSVSPPEIANLYSVAADVAAPLSTGGQKLGMTVDDIVRSFGLPFSFPFFEQSFGQIFVSTNGALYFGNGPEHSDAFSAKQALNGQRMIAGLWDDLDLTPCWRADSDVYLVTPDNDRIIFRWQGVKFIAPACTGAPGTPDPVNFEIELRRDGTIQLRYGQNSPLHAVVGIGGGEPEGYVINSHTAAGGPIDLANAQTVTFSLRRLPNQADLGLTTIGNLDYTQINQNYVFNVTATNLGPTGTGSVVLRDTLPNNSTFVSCTTTHGSCLPPSNGQIQVDIGTLNSGISASIVIVVQPTSSSFNPFFHRANIFGGLTDPNPFNNEVTALTQIVLPNQNPQTGITAIYAGANRSFAIRSDGYALAWGANQFGQLGDGSISDKSLPVRVNGINPVSRIDSSFSHSLGLKPDGTVWSWGSNNKGQLGDGTTLSRKRPAKIATLNNVTGISAGNEFSLALRSDGTVWAWGSNLRGQLGDSTTVDRNSPAQIPGLTNVVAISAGHSHALAVKSDGSVWAWGENESGQLGVTPSQMRATPAQVSGVANIITVSAGEGFSFFDFISQTIKTLNFSCALSSDGNVWCWGDNARGQLGDGTANNVRSIPQRVLGLTGVTHISTGAYHVLSLRNDGTVWAWGGNLEGQLGDLTRLNRPSPVKTAWLTGIHSIAAGAFHSLALTHDGHIFGWGSYSNGQLGFGGSVGHLPYPYQVSVQVPDPPPVGTVSTPVFTPAPGTFSTPQNVVMRSATADTTITSISVGFRHNLVTLSNGAISGWGDNNQNQLGPYTDPHPGPFPSNEIIKVPRALSGLTDAISLSAGLGHNLALKSDGSVWSWGANSSGQLGYATTNSRPHDSPTRVPGVSGITAVAAGMSNSLALSNDGTVWAWGINSEGGFGFTPMLVNGLSGVTAIACSGASFAIRDDRSLWGWGVNFDGQLGDGTTNRRPIPVQILSNVASVAPGFSHTVALKTDGTVWAWGRNSSGELGLGNDFSMRLLPVQVPGMSGVIAVAAGSSYTLVLKSDGTVWGWGSNIWGQLGDGTTFPRSSPVQITSLTGVSAIGARYEHSAALKTDGTLFTWGRNDASQLGDGTTDNSNVPMEMNQLTGGVVIHYTTNGADPTEDDPKIPSGSSILVSQTTTLKAKASKVGWTPSPITTGTYAIGPVNPIDDSRNFIRQQYLDFLNREPDAGGWDYWTAGITQCGSDERCIHNRRIDVSAAFFVELEFQETGYVVYRMYRAAFGTLPNGPSRANVLFTQFMADRSQLSAGPGLAQSTINFANAFVQRPGFLALYPNTLSNADFVNTLFDKANLTPFSAERQQQIDAMNNNGKTRAQVLLDVIEIPAFKTREYNGAFVLMQYFGYLRRDPDQGGYDFWLNVLNTQVPNNFRAMVCAFLTSAEYQHRFGTTVTRTNRDCAP